MSLRKVSLGTGFCWLMRAPLECEFQTELLYADDMLISTVRCTSKDSGPMVSAMRELFVSPTRRVRKELTFHSHSDWK